MSRYIKHFSWLLAILFVLMGSAVRAQQNPKRLILKDGSYQRATKWEVQGDRVRYYSADRYDWEEMPKDLVDWPATEKYNQEHEKQRTITAAEVTQEEEAEKRAEEAESPTVLPGLRLPDGGGVFLLDNYHGQPQLVEMVQNGGELNKQTGKNILRAALNPLTLSSRQTIEIKGLHARVQAHDTQPVFYMNVNQADSSPDPGGAPSKDTDQQPDRYRIVRLEEKKDNRVVGNLSIAIYGKVSEKEDWVKTTISPVGDWVKVSPDEALVPGEYALVEMLGKKQINLYVWDFGVNPAAPANSSAWVPRQPAQSNTGTNESPVLTKRPPL
jgi:hypothetical protein